MSDDKIEVVHSSSSGTIGRAFNEGHGVRIPLDSSSRPQPDTLTNSEAFLGAISSCGVTLIEMHAKETGVPLARMDVTIEGTRLAAEQTRYARIALAFRLAGVDQEQAEALVEVWRGR